MSAEESKPAALESEIPWYYPTPERCLMALLAIEGLFLLSLPFGGLGLNDDNAVTLAVIGVCAMVLLLICSSILQVFPRRFQFVGCGCFLSLVVMLGSLCVWIAAEMRRYEHYSRTQKRVVEAIDLLRNKRPRDVSPDRWERALSATHNAVYNCLGLPDWIADGPDGEDSFARFADELEERAQGRVGVETIDWMWDEIARLAKYSDDYMKQYRPLLWSKEH